MADDRETISNAPASMMMPSARQSFWRRVWTADFKQALALVGVLLLLVAVFGSISKNFLQWTTVATIANQIPDLTLIAVGMTFVLIIGGIDLSVGSNLALSSAVIGLLMVDRQWSLGTALLVAVLVSTIVGAINGAISVLARIPSFIVTLGMLEMARGASYLLTDSQTKYIGSRVEWIGEPIEGLGVSPAFVFAVATILLGQFLLKRTVFGRYCIAMGTNRETVRMAGVRASPYAIAVFAISGLMCGIAGMMQTSRLSAANPNTAIGLELSAIAACVIGGTSLRGGQGSVVSTFLGVLVINVLQTGLAQVGASDPTKRLITGAVIVLAVLADSLRQRRGTS